MKRIIIGVIISMFTFSMVEAQNSKMLDKHQWEDRLLLVVSNSALSISAKEQMEEILDNVEEVNNRKLVVYMVLPEKYKIMDFRSSGKDSQWIMSSAFYNDVSSKNDFNIILIGLDGTVKLNESKFTSIENIFSLIDSMPMRRQELKNRKN